MKIAGREIGPNEPPYIICEISCNHCGSLDEALALIEAAAWTGANACKVQAYEPGTITIDCDKPDFILKSGPWKGRKLYELYQRAHTPFAWLPELFEHAKSKDITMFASVFDPSSVDLLEKLGCPAYKIASMEITDLPLIKYVAKTKKPIIISTGMASEREVSDAYDAADRRQIRDFNSWGYHGETALLHCVSGYPTPIEESGLWSWDWSGKTIRGISDHTEGHDIAVAATAKGAQIIEKHLMGTVCRGSEDESFSLTPLEFRNMVNAVRSIWKACRQPIDIKSQDSSRQLRRSLYVVKDMKRGDIFTRDNVRSIRPAYGLPPRMIDDVLGNSCTMDIERGTALAKTHYAKGPG